MARGRPRVRKSSSAAAPSPARIATARLTYATASRVIDIIRQPLVILTTRCGSYFRISPFVVPLRSHGTKSLVSP